MVLGELRITNDYDLGELLITNDLRRRRHLILVLDDKQHHRVARPDHARLLRAPAADDDNLGELLITDDYTGRAYHSDCDRFVSIDHVEAVLVSRYVEHIERRGALDLVLQDPPDEIQPPAPSLL